MTKAGSVGMKRIAALRLLPAAPDRQQAREQADQERLAEGTLAQPAEHRIAKGSIKFSPQNHFTPAHTGESTVPPTRHQTVCSTQPLFQVIESTVPEWLRFVILLFSSFLCFRQTLQLKPPITLARFNTYGSISYN